MSIENGSGEGAALDAEVVVDTSPDPVDEARLAEGRELGRQAALAQAQSAVDSAHAKVAQAHKDLEGAEAAVAEAEATLAELEKE